MSADSAPAVAAEGVPPAPPAPDAPAGTRNLRRASVISFVTTITSHLLRLAGNVILTRLLFEEAYGIMGLIGVFLQGLQLFSDIGLRPAIIQNPKGEDPEFLYTAYTIQNVRGVLLSVIAIVAATPLAVFYDKPDIAAILPFAGLNAIINSLASNRIIVLERKLTLGRIAVLDFVSQVLGLLASVAWALQTPSVWALVFGSGVTAVTKTLLTHVALPGPRDRLRWNSAYGREILSFGRWISLSTALSFLANQSDRLILGKLLTAAQLGVYNIALLGATMPSVALSGLSGNVLFPALSRALQNSADPTADCRRLRLPILLAGGYLSSGIAGGATIVIRLLYDERYHAAGEMLRILSVGGWFSVVEVSAMYALMAAGGSGWMAWSSAAKLAAVSIMIPIGYSSGGVLGALVGFVLSDIVKYAVVMRGLLTRGVDVLAQDLRLSLLWIVAAAAAYAVSTATEQLGASFLWLVLRAALVALIVTVIWAPAGMSYRRESRRHA